MKQFILTLLIACSSVALMAQSGSIEGKVTDAETGEALRGASVSVVATKKGSYTDGTSSLMPLGTQSNSRADGTGSTEGSRAAMVRAVSAARSSGECQTASSGRPESRSAISSA